jgi:UDP-N-acetylglucosamine 3-dehydrogenase
MKFVKYGIVGCGLAGIYHLTAIKDSPKIRFVSAYDINQKLANRFAEKFKMNSFSIYEDFLESDIDAVLINVPHYLHEEMVVAAAETGKHVLCEKPMATTLEGCDKMIEATRKAGVKFMIAENHRFLPAHNYMMEAVQKGLIGNVFLIRSYEGVMEKPRIMDPNSWKCDPIKAGGGALMDMGVHKFVTMNWILNDQIESAYCWITKQFIKLSGKAEDNAMILLKYKCGTIAESILSFTVASPPSNQLEIYGTVGTLVENHNWKNPVKIYSSHNDMGKNHDIWYEPKIEHSPWPRYQEISTKIEDEYFTDCILEDNDPEFTPEQAREAIANVLMGYLSVKRNTTVTYEDLMEIYNTKGTKSILEGLENYVQNNYYKD